HATLFVSNKLKGRTTKYVLGTLAALLAIMLIPWPYRIACDCELQPVLRRFIAAPHNGVLEKNLVENGDVIETGQVVAHLDGRQLRIELAGLQAELKGTAKRRSAAMASNQIADAQIAMSEMKKLKSEIQLVEDKLSKLEIKSPIEGIVVAGDLEKVEGAPVEMGQTLFEVGPLYEMLAEIAIPEEEIPYAKPGMSIDIKLNAFPFETWSGSIVKIHPKTEILNDKSVFIAEVILKNPAGKLKPGMKGHAKVNSDAYPIGWNLFHSPLEQIRYWTIW
ncbi:MAG: efflux RND transporter periplasmic adaptor subunit, partial [Planctomycetota bacterium]